MPDPAPSTLWFVQNNRKMPSKEAEISVGGEYSEVMSHGNGAYEIVGVRPLHSLCAANVEESCGRDVVVGYNVQIGKSGKMTGKPVELRLFPDA